MHRLLLLATAAILPASAQSLVDADNLAAARIAFEEAPSAPALKCSFTSVSPALNFSLRFQAGFSLELPMNQFHGPGHAWDVLLRVTPEGRQPVFLTKSETLPTVPDTKVANEVTGTFIVGEGAYTVDALLKDDARRACLSTWRIQARAEGIERGLRPSLPPGTVAELAAKPAVSRIARQAKWGRLTVILHAAPLFPGRAQLPPDDVRTLAGSLAALIEQAPVRTMRVTVVNLDQRAVLYKNDDFTAADLDRVTKALTEIQLAAVSYKALQDDYGPFRMALELLLSEVARPDPSGAVVFLGPPTPMHFKHSTAVATVMPLEGVKLFYLQCRPGPFAHHGLPDDPLGRSARGSGVAPLPIRPNLYGYESADAIALLTKAVKGETDVVYTPHDFAAALMRILGNSGR